MIAYPWISEVNLSRTETDAPLDCACVPLLGFLVFSIYGQLPTILYCVRQETCNRCYPQHKDHFVTNYLPCASSSRHDSYVFITAIGFLEICFS